MYVTAFCGKPANVLNHSTVGGSFIFCWPCISVQFLLTTNLTYFLMHLFISFLYMFRATQCSLSGESIVSIHYLVCVTLCRWLSGMPFPQYRHTRLSPTQSDTYHMMYWYNWLSWWWALGCSKHVEKGNK